jgi:hypothetical protein
MRARDNETKEQARKRAFEALVAASGYSAYLKKIKIEHWVST